MMRPRLTAFAVVAAVALAGCAEDVRKDLDTLCNVAIELEADGQVKAKDKPRVLAYRLQDAGFGTRATKILEKTAEAPEAERYYTLRLLAVEAGSANYECAPLKRMFGGVMGQRRR
jgi:hypothetical protein